jgi:hypothetical protein
MSTATYAVGWGKPPLHTRFKKGRSGNPSGKPGPAGLAKQRFLRALCAALEESVEELELSKAGSTLDSIARRTVRDAAQGRMPAVRLVISQLDAERGTEPQTEEDSRVQSADEPEPEPSLVQGKTQGSGKTFLEDMLWPAGQQQAPPADVDSRREPGKEMAPAASGPEREEAKLFSLVQGKTQGNGKIPAGRNCAETNTDGAFHVAAAQTRTGAQPMTGTAVSSGRNIRFGTPPPRMR